MNATELQEEIIARRSVEWYRPDGTISPVHIELMRPMQCADSDDYTCRYRIHGLEQTPKERDAYGVDSVQALLLCVKMIGIDIEIARKKFDLRWLGTQEDNLGFGTP